MSGESKKGSRIRYPSELREKTLLELAESGDTKAVALHYNINQQTLYNWKSDLKRKDKKLEKKRLEGDRGGAEKDFVLLRGGRNFCCVWAR